MFFGDWATGETARGAKRNPGALEDPKNAAVVVEAGQISDPLDMAMDPAVPVTPKDQSSDVQALQWLVLLFHKVWCLNSSSNKSSTYSCNPRC